MGEQTGHKAGALGTAQGMRAIGAGEPYPRFGEAIHIGGVHVGVADTGHGSGVLLVRDDEENIGTTFWHI